jgi:hypothetical protein
VKSDPELASLILPIQDEKIVDMEPTSLHCYRKLDEANLESKLEYSAFLAEMIHPRT